MALGWAGKTQVAQEQPLRRAGAHSPLQGGKPEALHAELDEGPQVRLADPPYGVDVCAGAVVLGEVAEEASGERGAGRQGQTGWENPRSPGHVVRLQMLPTVDISRLASSRSLAGSRLLEKVA